MNLVGSCTTVLAGSRNCTVQVGADRSIHQRIGSRIPAAAEVRESCRFDPTIHVAYGVVVRYMRRL